MTQPAASEIRVGAVLQDTYEITSLLGKGGMGAVFLARHRRLPGRQVAVKVLQNSASLNPELYARFRREAEIASQLRHPNIVEVLGFDTLPDGTPFLIMEYLRGESLEQRLLRGRIPLDETLSLVRQVGSALQAAHRAGVVHRDLKPANVFLAPTDSGGVVGERVKLLDFGISKMLDSQTLQTQEAVLMGTPQYMSPEQALGKNREIDARADLFALGCIVYEMLSGTPPFAGDGGGVVQVVFRIVHAQPEPLANLCPDVPARVLSAVERALSKSPQDRHPDVAAFIAELTGSPLQSLSSAAVPSLSASRALSGPSAASEEDGLGATLVPSSTARVSAPVAAWQAAGARRRPRAGRRVGVVVPITGLLAIGWWLGSRSSAPAPVHSEPAAVVAPAPVAMPALAFEVPSETEVPSPPAPFSEPVSVADATAASEASTTAETRRPWRQRMSEETLPESVRRDLDAAERALDAGDCEQAIQLAKRSQQTQITQASFSLIARAYCSRGDLSNARAQWRRLLPAERIRVRRYCTRYEVDL